MRKSIAILFAGLLAGLVQAADAPPPDSARLEKELQRLPWEQFKSVVSAVPKMKADVDAYGPMGWNFVKTRYQTHSWRKNIDKLDPAQKQLLQDLIRKTGKPAAAPH